MNTWHIEFKIHGSIKLHESLHRRSTLAVKAVSAESPIFTEIELRTSPNERHIRSGYFSVIFTVQANTQKESLDIGRVYASQLCDLLSFLTRVATQHEMDEDTRGVERSRSRYAPTSDRLLRPNEWEWIIRWLPYLKKHESKFMAACSWYRRGLCCDEVTERICCYWRTVERCANSYAKELVEEGKGTKAKIGAFIKEFISNPPELLANEKQWKEVYELRNDISHGNKPLDSSLIDRCAAYLERTEEAAYCVLTSVCDALSEKYPNLAEGMHADTQIRTE